MSMTPDQAAAELRKGRKLAVDVDIAVEALGLTVPHLFRHIDPTVTDGKGSLARFRQLADNAGLPHDHPVFAGWFALRALRVTAGDAVLCETGCPVTTALLTRIGAAPISTNGYAIRADDKNPDAVSITEVDPALDEEGAIATPAGTIRIPGSTVHCPVGTWSSALTAIDKVAGTIGRRTYDADPDAVVELDWSRPASALAVEADSIHEDWSPEIATHPDLKPHPARLIQSATLATVTPPKASYRPRLTRRVIQSGRISDAQFDFLVAAGEAHSRHLPIDPENPSTVAHRVGIYLADGTGAGKTNEMLGVALDNILRGRRKAILVLSKRRHLSGFIDAWQTMGRNPNDFTLQWDCKAEDTIGGSRGILVTTYSLLRDFKKDAGFVRVNQIANWAGREFDGAMLLDEAQEMRNAAGNEDRSGKSSEVSRQGLAGIALQDALPDARVVYGSATGATDVHNLAYAVRLGLWGEGTCFKDRHSFIRTFEEGGIADLEQVTLSLKASGVYVARSLSFDGVEVTHLPVTLTADERRVYNEAATMWTRLHDAFHHCAKLCNVPLSDKQQIAEMRKRGLSGSIPYSHLNSIYESNRKIAMSTLIAAFKARGVIEDAREKIDAGHAVVIQMQNTYEAQLNRALSRLTDVENIRLEPAELISFAEQLPVQKFKITVEPRTVDGKTTMTTVYTPVLDDKGNIVEDPNAVALRNTLIGEARSIKLPLPPLDQIMLAFGPARIAEVTGRTRRLIPDKPFGNRDGATGIKIEERIEADRAADIRSFHDGEKPILAFSTGAGGSSLSYHAKIGTKAANARRVHYLIQLGYRADEVTQGIGRTHRSDQTMPPLVSLVTVDLPADRLYASRIVSALFKLGALTQGHRHATSNGMFDERDCLDGPYAEKAWDDLQAAIQDGLIPNYDWIKFMQDMGLSASGEEDYEVWGKSKQRYVLNDVNRLINRVAALTDRRQQLIFDKLREFIDKRIEQAITDGTFNAGPEILKATSLAIMTDRNMEADRVHGGSTRILRIRKKSELASVSFGEAYKRYLKSRGGSRYAWFAKHRTTGTVALITSGKPIITALGDKIPTNDIITPTGIANRPRRFVDREPWMPFSALDDTLEGIWNAAVDAAPTESTSFITIIAGALLPVWSVLSKASGVRNAVYRLKTDDGSQIVGRPIGAHMFPSFCAAVGESARPDDTEVDEIITYLKSGAKVALASGSKSAPHFLVGEWSGGKMTGAAIEISSNLTESLAAVLDALPGTGHNRHAGSTCLIASRAADLAHAVASVMGICPAIYVEEGASQPPAASAPSQKVAAVQSLATAA